MLLPILLIHASLTALVVLNCHISICMTIRSSPTLHYFTVIIIFVLGNVKMLLLKLRIHSAETVLVTLNRHISVRQSSPVPSYIMSQ